ncbi:MAG: VCBS repeat-containing protein, partial [Acidobacteria bacterium]|nr:VCBS repeat-containing protein [Acidobacteriota bacterium]
MQHYRMKSRLMLLCALVCALVCVAALRVAWAGGGLLNNSFGSGGKVSMQLTGTNDYVQTVVTQPDGRIVGVGTAGSSPLVVRFLSNGQLDSGFGSGGIFIPTPLTIARGLALQADGKILVAGSAPDSGGLYGLAVARLNSNGSLDTGFGHSGVSQPQVFNGRGDYATSIAIQPDGKIVLAGIAGIAYQDSDFAVARYNSDGSPDTSFGTGGQAHTSFGDSRDQAYAVAIQADGKILVSGDGTVSNYEVDFALARYNANGTPDTAFDGDGKLTTRFFFQNFARAYALKIQPDGKILAAGSAGVIGDYRFGLARYNADGSADQSFGTSGVQTLTFPGYARADGNAVALQADGRIIVGGDAFSYSEDYNFALARFTSNGQLDTSFGNAGRVTTNFGAEDVAYAMSLQSNGTILLAGQTGQYPDYAIALASYTNDAAVRRSVVADYDGDGTSDLSVFRPDGGMWFLSQSTGGFRAQAWGASGDVLVPADYDGDGKTDVAVFRQGNWYILKSTDGTLRAQSFGQSGDVAVPGD